MLTLILALAPRDILTSLNIQWSMTVAVWNMVVFAVIDDNIESAQFHYFQYYY
jgi:hypothetical protein